MKGKKSVTINVTIKELLHELHINTSNIKEGSNKIRQHVIDALNPKHGRN